MSVTARRLRVVERPDGTYAVEVRRTGVEPSAGLLPGYVIALITRLRWQLSREKSWSLEAGSDEPSPCASLQALVAQRGLPVRDGSHGGQESGEFDGEVG
jgi:hypothetical protein